MPTQEGSQRPTRLLHLYAEQVADQLGFLAARVDVTDDERAAIDTVTAMCQRIRSNR